jgi:hypothetical protein
MRSILIIATAASLFVGGALAAQNPPAQSGPSNPAVKTTEGNNANAPVAGANSFTEGQAKSRIETQGFSKISTLTKDKDGVWRGKATKGNREMDVSVDFQGNVVAKP